MARLAGWPAYRWVFLLLTGFFVAALAATWITYLNFHINGIGYFDLSINQQALSSTIHSSQPFPFYESTNCGRDGRCSFLLVHPVLFAYVVAVPYAVWSSPFTLFAIQDLFLALAALPLFAIARKVTQSDRLSIAIAATYLVWLPSFSGIFSFHWEAFIPFEFFLIFWLWLTDRYLLALPVVLVSLVTLEIVPVLLFFMAVFFLLPWLRPFLKLLRSGLGDLWERKGSRAVRLRSSMTRIGQTILARPRIIASLYLLGGSIVAYVLLHQLVTTGGPLLGLPALPAKYAIPLTRPVYAAVFTFQSLSTGWQAKLLYWLVIYATLAMIPLLAPRTLVLAVPWVVFSVFATAGYYRMSTQYAFVSSALLFVGFVYGIAQLKQWAETVPRRQEEPEPASPGTQGSLGQAHDSLAGFRKAEAAPAAGQGVPPTEEAGAPSGPTTTPGPAAKPSSVPGPFEVAPWRSRRMSRRRRLARASLTVILAGVIAFNLFLSPLNPLAASLKNDRPFVPQGSLSIWGGLNTTDYDHMEKLVSMIGNQPIVGVSPLLFTFVANDPYAYPLLRGMNLSNLPFDAISQTQYVILLDHGGNTVPAFLSPELYNASIFGVRAWIPTTYLGAVLLFEKGYTGPTEILGNAAVFSGGSYTPGAGLEPGPSGVIAENNTSQSGTVIETAPVPGQTGLNQTTGQVFLGPDVTLTGGSYQVTLVVNGYVTMGTFGTRESAPVVTFLLSGFQAVLNRTVLNLSALHGGGWTAFTFNVTVPYPLLDFTVAGYDRQDWFHFQIDYLSITPVSFS